MGRRPWVMCAFERAAIRCMLLQLQPGNAQRDAAHAAAGKQRAKAASLHACRQYKCTNRPAMCTLPPSKPRKRPLHSHPPWGVISQSLRGTESSHCSWLPLVLRTMALGSGCAFPRGGVPPLPPVPPVAVLLTVLPAVLVAEPPAGLPGWARDRDRAASRAASSTAARQRSSEGSRG